MSAEDNYSVVQAPKSADKGLSFGRHGQCGRKDLLYTRPPRGLAAPKSQGNVSLHPVICAGGSSRWSSWVSSQSKRGLVAIERTLRQAQHPAHQRGLLGEA